jgi:hypothetical protein
MVLPFLLVATEADFWCHPFSRVDQTEIKQPVRDPAAEPRPFDGYDGHADTVDLM